MRELSEKDIAICAAALRVAIVVLVNDESGLRDEGEKTLASIFRDQWQDAQRVLEFLESIE